MKKIVLMYLTAILMLGCSEKSAIIQEHEQGIKDKNRVMKMGTELEKYGDNLEKDVANSVESPMMNKK